MAPRIDYNDWLPKSSRANRLIAERPTKFWNLSKTKPFEFYGCDYCYSPAAFTCRHCNIHYCVNEECKEFHENDHVLVRLGPSR